jgi:hypothetical protein
MEFRSVVSISAALALSREELGAQIHAREVAQGFSIVTEARWFDPDEWDRWTIISQDGFRIRLVALSAAHPHTGAFKRLVERINGDKMIPVVVEPNAMLAEWCRRHSFRKRTCGQGEFRHVIWYPKWCCTYARDRVRRPKLR